jgi:hypothetical protein
MEEKHRGSGKLVTGGNSEATSCSAHHVCRCLSSAASLSLLPIVTIAVSAAVVLIAIQDKPRKNNKPLAVRERLSGKACRSLRTSAF